MNYYLSISEKLFIKNINLLLLAIICLFHCLLYFLIFTYFICCTFEIFLEKHNFCRMYINQQYHLLHHLPHLMMMIDTHFVLPGDKVCSIIYLICCIFGYNIFSTFLLTSYSLSVSLVVFEVSVFDSFLCSSSSNSANDFPCV